MPKKRDEPTSVPDLEGGKTFTVKTQSGRYREIPGRQCDDWKRGQPADDKWRPDFSKITPCDRCQGHGDRDGWHRGGYIPLLIWDLDSWQTRIAACECPFGAWIAETNKMRFYDDSPYALLGLGFDDLRELESKLRGHREELNGLRVATEAVFDQELHDRIARALDQREIREQHAEEAVPRYRPPDNEKLKRIRQITDTLAEVKRWDVGWRST